MYPYDSNLIGLLQQQQIPNQQAEKHVVKVNGRAGAESYNMPPNSDEILLDVNNPIIWFVQTDGAGYKTITPYDISLHKEVNQNDIIKSMEDRIARLEEAVRNGRSNTTYTKPAKSGNTNNDAGVRGLDKG